jgi:hypothetical protein
MSRKYWVANYPEKSTTKNGAGVAAELFEETQAQIDNEESSNALAASNLLECAKVLQTLTTGRFADNANAKAKLNAFLSQGPTASSGIVDLAGLKAALVTHGILTEE